MNRVLSSLNKGSLEITLSPFNIGFYYPMNYMEGVQVDFEKLTNWSPPESVKDYENIIARYSLLNLKCDVFTFGWDRAFTHQHIHSVNFLVERF